jgi:hypothetical protein
VSRALKFENFLEHSLCGQLSFPNDDDDDGAGYRNVHVELQASGHGMAESSWQYRRRHAKQPGDIDNNKLLSAIDQRHSCPQNTGPAKKPTTISGVLGKNH